MQTTPHVRRSASVVGVLIASLLLGSCASTVSEIDTAAQTVQPQFSAAKPTPEIPQPSTAAGVGLSVAPATQTVLATEAGNAPVVPVVPATDETATQGQLTAAATEVVPEGTLPAPAQPGEAVAAPEVATPQPATLESPAPLVVVNQPTDLAAAEPAAITVPAPSDPGAAAKTQDATVATAAAASLTSDAPSLTAAEPQPEEPAKKPRKTLFAAMFGDTQQKKQPTSTSTAPLAEPQTAELALAAPASPPVVSDAVSTEIDTSQLRLTQASLSQTPVEEPQSAPTVDNGDLPGVRKGALFEIKRRDSLDSDADIDIGETDGGPVLLASAGGFARLAPNGLKVQRQSVDVACLKPQLVRMLKKIEAHYNTSVVVTSGYRSPNYNRRVRGAKNSLHMYCAAADIQVVGVGKWELARYLRSMPGRGGVGTYCHTDSVHVDIGPDRDWNWRCSRRK